MGFTSFNPSYGLRAIDMVKTIYLDTHHISRAEAGRSNLLRYFDRPELQFFYSATHVIECLPKTEVENRGAVECLRLIMGPRAKHLLSWAHVAKAERSINKCKIEDLECSRKSDMMFPGFKINRKQWDKKIRDDLKRLLREKFTDQNVRRSWQAKFLKGGRLTPGVFEFLRAQRGNVAHSIVKEMPPAEPLMAGGDIYDFLEGRISEKDFTERFMDVLADPVALASLSSLPGFESILEFSRFFWTEMDGVAEMLSRLVKNLLVEQINGQEFDYQRKVRPAIEKFTKTAELRSSIAWRFCGLEISPSELGDMPGTRLFVDVFCQYMIEIADRYANRTSPDFGVEPDFKRSDMADFTHVLYLPYVDIFGCDGAMRNRIKKAGWIAEKIVISDAELERRLSEVVRLD
jgi:hypothetical protein